MKATGFSVCVRTTLSKFSPVGTAESSPGRSPGNNSRHEISPAGTTENAPGCNPGVSRSLKGTIRDSMERASCCQSAFHTCGPGSPRTNVRDAPGHSQPSLRDWSRSECTPRTASWATFSRPYGTDFGECSSHADRLSARAQVVVGGCTGPASAAEGSGAYVA